jgi:hypothetical protein
MKTIFCLAEDRRGAEIGLKLAILSVAEHCPGSRVVLFRPQSAPGFADWLRGFAAVELVTAPLEGASNWNCKPHALLKLLPELDSESQLVWLDSDLMLTRDIRPLLAAVGRDGVVVTQEPVNQPFRGTEVRTRGWDLPLGRAFPDSLNSCLVRVTDAHSAFLQRWFQLLGDRRYTAVASLPIERKPVHLWGDQDVMAALLGAEEFAQAPVRMLRHGREILHTGGALGFTLGERLRGLALPLPAVLHAIAGKPWVLLLPENRTPGRFAWFRRLLQETSPFVAYARRYRDRVDEPMVWLDYRTLTGTLLKLLGLGHWALRGLPVTLVATLARRVRRMG